MRTIFILLLLSVTGFAKTHVLVSIAPQKFLVEEIGGDRVHVEVIVPAGASSHTYEPSPRQVVSMRQGEIWFRLGESFEERVAKALPQTLVIDQRQGIELLGCSCHPGSADPHTWLSPRLLKMQAGQIAGVLSSRDPEYATFYHENLRKLEKRLTELDEELKTILSNAPKTFLVSHPAYGYLCRDYGLTQLPIEMEGREPTPRYLTEVLIQAKRLNLQTVFTQQQHSVKGAKRVAAELGATCIILDPYAENVIENLRVIAKAIRQCVV